MSYKLNRLIFVPSYYHFTKSHQHSRICFGIHQRMLYNSRVWVKWESLCQSLKMLQDNIELAYPEEFAPHSRFYLCSCKELLGLNVSEVYWEHFLIHCGSCSNYDRWGQQRAFPVSLDEVWLEKLCLGVRDTGRGNKQEQWGEGWSGIMKSRRGIMSWMY